MKHLNFLSKSSSQSCGHNVVTLASTVGSPSAHRRGIMLKLISVLVLILTFGVGNVLGAVPTGWSEVTSLSGIAAGDKIIIVTNNGSNYFNGTQSSGHFQVTALSASAPASASAAGVIELVSTGTTNRYKLKLVSTNKYVTASAAKSGSGVVNSSSDDSGWTFSYSSGFNAQYQKSGQQAYYRSYSNNSFRTYANTSSGATFKIYKYSSAASHTLSSAVSPEASGSVSLSATSVAEGSTATATATPAAHYTFTSWSISGTGASLSSTTTNPTTVTMGTANATVTANFTQAPKASITLSEAGATTTDETTYYVGDEYTLPSSTEATCNGKVLVGWSLVEVAETNTKPSSNFYEPGEEVTLVASQTFYAVFANSAGSAKTYQFDITANDFNTTSYAANNNEKTTKAVNTSDATDKMDVKWTSNQVMKNSSNMQFQKNNGYIYNSTDLGTINSVTVTSSAGGYNQWYGTTSHPTSGTSLGSDKGFFTVKENNTATGTVSNIRVNFTKSSATYSAYSTTCCTPLASINGSVF